MSEFPLHFPSLCYSEIPVSSLIAAESMENSRVKWNSNADTRRTAAAESARESRKRKEAEHQSGKSAREAILISDEENSDTNNNSEEFNTIQQHQHQQPHQQPHEHVQIPTLPIPAFSFELPFVSQSVSSLFSPHLTRVFQYADSLFSAHHSSVQRDSHEVDSLLSSLSGSLSISAPAERRRIRDEEISGWQKLASGGESADEKDWRIAAVKRKLMPMSEEERASARELMSLPGDRLVCEGFSIELRGRDLVRLNAGQWLNDEIINFYFELLAERSKRLSSDPAVPSRFALRCYYFNTYFYKKLIDFGRGYNFKSVARWTRRNQVDIATFDRVFIPIHVNENHWCLSVIDFKYKKFRYFDSLGGRNPECFKMIRKYTEEEYKTVHKSDFSLADWTDELETDIPMQNNGSDCGMFTIKFADFLSQNLPLQFSASEMMYFRQRAALELKAKRIV